MDKLKITIGTLLVLSTFAISAFAFTLPSTLPTPFCTAKLNASQPAVTGIPVSFDASSSTCFFTPIVGYTFDFGDGTVITTTNPTVLHNYRYAGTYKAVVIVSGATTKAIASVSVAVSPAIPDVPIVPSAVCGNGVRELIEQCDDGNTVSGDGCSSACTIEIPVVPEITGCPDVSFSSSVPAGTAPLKVIFLAGADSPTSSQSYWNFTLYYDYDKNPSAKKIGMIGADTRAIGSYNYSSGGHTARLYVSCVSGQISKDIVITALPAIDYSPVIGWFRSDPHSGYAPLTTKFRSSAITLSPLQPNPLSYTLFFDVNDRSKNASGTINSTDSVLGEFTYLSGGTFGKIYTSELVVTDSTGKSSLKKTTTSVSPAWTDPDNIGNNYPQTAFSYSPTIVYIDQQVNFTDLSVDTDGTIANWLWTFGDGASSSLQNPTHVYASAGIYTVALKAYDDDGYSNITRMTIIAIDISAPVCGDGIIGGAEQCDDNNAADGDGCNSVCVIESAAQPAASGGGGGGNGMYLVQTPAPLKTSGITYLGFHPSYALNGTRTYSFDNRTNITVITLRIVNLAKVSRIVSIRDMIPKTLANSLDDVQVIPVPQMIYNMDPEIGWNATIAPHEVFEIKYIFKKYIPFSEFSSMPLPSLVEVREAEEIPVSPESQTTVFGAGITGFVISALGNVWVGLFIAIVILAVFFAGTDKGKKAWKGIETRSKKFVSDLSMELEEPKQEDDKGARVKKLKKLVKSKKKGKKR